jgi:Co/Zn/Cd efflux system component
MLGAIVVIKWAVGLIRQTGSILLDVGDFTSEIKTIQQRLEKDGSTVKDIHIWQISENERSLIVSLSTASGKAPKDYHNLIAQVSIFDHVTIEVNRKIERQPVGATSVNTEQYA